MMSVLSKEQKKCKITIRISPDHDDDLAKTNKIWIHFKKGRKRETIYVTKHNFGTIIFIVKLYTRWHISI